MKWQNLGGDSNAAGGRLARDAQVKRPRRGVKGMPSTHESKDGRLAGPGPCAQQTWLMSHCDASD